MDRLTLADFRRIFAPDPAPWINRPGITVTQGSASATMAEWRGIDWRRLLPAGFTEREEWADGHYRQVYVSPDARAIVTYCEGDIDVDTADNAEHFTAELDYCRNYYERG